MSGKHPVSAPAHWEVAVELKDRPGRKQRLIHVAWAAVISFVMLSVVLFEPIDQTIWAIQSRTASGNVSGDIVFVGAESDLSDPIAAPRRAQLAEVLDYLDSKGVEQVFIDFAFSQYSEPANDRALAQSIAALGDRVALVDQLDIDFEGNTKLAQSLPGIRGGAQQLVNSDYSGFVGIAWSMARFEVIADQKIETLVSALSGVAVFEEEEILLDYSAPIANIPYVPFKNLTLPESRTANNLDFSKKHVVIGPAREASSKTVAIPGQRDVPLSYISIYAAENLKQGKITQIDGWIVLAFFMALLLGAASISERRKLRLFCYVAVTAILTSSLALCAIVNLRAELSYPGFAIIIFALLRLRQHWQERAALRDQETGLPTLRALERNMMKKGATGFVVIAKVQDFGRVLKSLPRTLQPTYVLRIADRLRANDPDLDLHFSSHYFAWLAQAESFEALEEHLEGLRALFAMPLHISGKQIDAGVTFGVALAQGQNIRSLPAAVAAAEETSEALFPIKLAEQYDVEEELWDISMRARIDAAMECGEVYCVYQPKVNVETGKTCGVEALVRWDDPERGPIPPMHFIRESEKAGRMDHLTRYVLQSACTAGRLLHANGYPISMSVNISATLCSDRKIVDMIQNTLQATQFPPEYLVLEVTETARIRDLSKASAILQQMKGLGVRISMDDFGVGEANFETFYELPFDELKIDRLFIKDITKDPKARAIATSLIAMGNEARITVVAEGVEHMEDLAILKEIGCTEVQGFALSRPVSLANLLIYLEVGAGQGLSNVV